MPVHWDHDRDASAVIGSVDPATMHEQTEGLYVKGKLDIEDSEMAREAWRSVKRNRIGLSFGFLVVDEHDDNGVKVLDTLDVFEITLTPSTGQRGREDLVSEERRARPRPQSPRSWSVPHPL